MVVRIESPDNNRIKLVRKLQTRKGRDTENKFVVEGINLVSEAFSRQIRMNFVMVSDEYDNDKVRELEASDLLVCRLPESIFNRITDAENGVGILAVIDRDELNTDIHSAVTEQGNILVLDRLQDPGNIGTVIRTAVAAGYEMVIAVKGTADMLSPKVLRSTAGMIFNMPFMYVNDAAELKKVLQSLNKSCVVTTVDGGHPYYEENLKEGIALVIGNEGNGVSQEVLEMADVRVTIPMKGNIESLNAAVAATILMYEAVRQ